MKKHFAVIATVSFLFAADCIAVPPCYENADIPAHEFIFKDVKGVYEVTALARDGQSCRQIRFYNGEPVTRQKFYMPFGKLYEAYARAIEKRDVKGLRKLYAYGRPTPRNLEQFMPLANEPPGPPMPWGKTMFDTILDVLQPYPDFKSSFLRTYNPGTDGEVWGALFFLMGGELVPDEGKWVAARRIPKSVGYFHPLAWFDWDNGRSHTVRYRQ